MAVVDIVKYDGNPDVFAWKYPEQNLGTWTQVIVNESQVAMLFKGGQALDVFMPGRHTLDTANIPLLNGMINLPFGKKSPFMAEIWFINKAFNLDIKWGTPTAIQLQDPKFKMFVPVRSYGQFGIQIEDPKMFLVKLVGTLAVFNKDNINRYFRGVFVTKAKDSISSYLIKREISILEMNAYLDELSEHLKEKISPALSEFGIKLVNFYVNDVNVPETDSGVIKLKDALAKRAEMEIVGYNYVQERSFDTLEGAAKNPSSNQSAFMGAGMGLGMGFGMGGAMANNMGSMAQNININETKKCPKCNADVKNDSHFCGVCGCDVKSVSNADKFKCSKCNTVISNISAKFCPHCGDKLTYSCSKCNNEVDSNSRFCPHCGNNMKGDQ